MTAPPDPPGYDTLGWPRDVLAAWIEADEAGQRKVHEALPEVARALDRQAEVVKIPRSQRRPRRLRDPDQPPRPVPWQEPDA